MEVLKWEWNRTQCGRMWPRKTKGFAEDPCFFSTKSQDKSDKMSVFFLTAHMETYVRVSYFCFHVQGSKDPPHPVTRLSTLALCCAVFTKTIKAY